MENISASLLKQLFLGGAHALNREKAAINELNVFPVPDGDTGTNMTMTAISACREVLAVEDENDMEAVCRAISSGALRGARGNSGVILSQILRGFTRYLREKPVLTVRDVAEATEKAVESAYKAVMKPKEGTILTVAKGISEKALSMADTEDLETFLAAVLSYGEEVLKKTPDLLPVLKQAGVVDSGGQGLLVFLRGAEGVLKGEPVDMTVPVLAAETAEDEAVDTSNLETSEICFGYCTEFIIKTREPMSEEEEWRFKDFLESIGDSIVLVSDEDIVKVHVHTNDPGVAITRALTYGELSRLKIDNMREEHEERLFKNAEALAKKQKEEDDFKRNLFNPETAEELGFVAVCSGDGLRELFEELGASFIIEGGQTMNPSTEDFLNAIRHVNAKEVVLLPNNGNVLLAAQQAAKMTNDRRITVIPTTTVMEGISALVNILPGEPPEVNVKVMDEARKRVTTVEVTYAVRDTEIDDTKIKLGDYMAISGKHILSNGGDLSDVVANAVAKSADDDATVISLYYGSDIDGGDAEALGDLLQERYPDAEVDVTYGGQPVYYYLISIE